MSGKFIGIDPRDVRHITCIGAGPIGAGWAAWGGSGRGASAAVAVWLAIGFTGLYAWRKGMLRWV